MNNDQEKLPPSAPENPESAPETTKKPSTGGESTPKTEKPQGEKPAPPSKPAPGRKRAGKKPKAQTVSLGLVLDTIKPKVDSKVVEGVRNNPTTSSLRAAAEALAAQDPVAFAATMFAIIMLLARGVIKLLNASMLMGLALARAERAEVHRVVFADQGKGRFVFGRFSPLGIALLHEAGLGCSASSFSHDLRAGRLALLLEESGLALPTSLYRLTAMEGVEAARAVELYEQAGRQADGSFQVPSYGRLEELAAAEKGKHPRRKTTRSKKRLADVLEKLEAIDAAAAAGDVNRVQALCAEVRALLELPTASKRRGPGKAKLPPAQGTATTSAAPGSSGTAGADSVPAPLAQAKIGNVYVALVPRELHLRYARRDRVTEGLVTPYAQSLGLKWDTDKPFGGNPAFRGARWIGFGKIETGRALFAEVVRRLEHFYRHGGDDSEEGGDIPTDRPLRPVDSAQMALSLAS